MEVKRRLDVAVQEKINTMRSKTSVDEDEKALKAFIQFRDAYKINY
jgi:hypothetical protein